MNVKADESMKGGQGKARTVIMQREDGLIEVFWYSDDDMEEVTRHKDVVDNRKNFKSLQKNPYITREATGFWALRGKRY